MGFIVRRKTIVLSPINYIVYDHMLWDLLLGEENKMKTIEDAVAFLKNAGTYYLATDDHGQPRVRPFGTAHIYEGSVYIQTGKKKAVSRQLHENPKLEICAFSEGVWLRIEAEAEEDDRREARASMLDAYPELRRMYNEDDGNTEVFRLKKARARL